MMDDMDLADDLTDDDLLTEDLMTDDDLEDEDEEFLGFLAGDYAADGDFTEFFLGL